MPSVKLTARYVSWVDEANPAKSLYLKTGYASVDGTTGKRKQALIWFSSPFGPEGGNVTSAVLTVRARAISGTGTHALAAGIATKWALAFGRLTWGTRPSNQLTPVTVSKVGARPQNDVWTFDLTRHLQAVADGTGMYGIVVTSSVAELVLLQGQMGGGLNPTLDVTWTMAPKSPTKLSPAGGRLVGEPKPTLRWDFFDHVGENQLSAMQVQTATSSTGFGAPSWDSGVVASRNAALDLSATTFPALAVGGSVWWRVRNQDDAGVWSGWSAPAQFAYRPRLTLKLQNPSAATPWFVDPTPPIDWTVTGGVQAGWRVEILVWDGHKWGMQETTGIRPGADTRWTPTRRLRYANARYLIRVCVWDALSREATPGMPVYAIASEEVQFRPSAATTSVYNLEVRNDDSSPAVRLTWTQPQQPDRWMVWRDDVLLTSYAGDQLLNGAAPKYHLTDRWCPAGEHTWRVQAIVNGEPWKSGSITARAHHVGTWLVDADSQQAVRFVGDTDHDMTMPEDVAVHTPLGARHSVAITGGRRGYEGTIDGELMDGRNPPGHTARQWRQNLLDFKTDSGRELLLLIEDQAMPVMVSNITVAGMPAVEDAWEASLSFRQVDSYIF